MVYKDDLIYIYVDFIPITSTSSPDDALALLIGMYTIFELCFNKNGRTIRFLYSYFYDDKRFLSNSIRIFIKENSINIDSEQNQQIKPDAQNQSISACEIVQQSEPQIDQITETYSSQNNVADNPRIVLNTNK